MSEFITEMRGLIARLDSRRPPLRLGDEARRRLVAEEDEAWRCLVAAAGENCDAGETMRAIMERTPRLTEFGAFTPEEWRLSDVFAFGRPLRARTAAGRMEQMIREHVEARAEFQEMRDELLKLRNLAGFVAARCWLHLNVGQAPLKPPNGSVSSYALKHLIGLDTGYMNHGVTIAAAIAEGCAVERVGPKETAVWIAVSLPPWVWARLSAAEWTRWGKQPPSAS
jgi:hypothetical protein